ncbi:MAG: ABC transporter permease, partial [Planctomycetota bacterium]|nr:ABC transporter permease [Planctomycetota bacterium]
MALLCLSRTEPQVTGVDQTLVTGRWFDNDDERAVILPQHVATQLGLGADAVGKLVRVFGQELPVVGVVDEKRFDAIRDIDGEPLTPVNFVLQQQIKAQQGERREEEADTLDKYEHYSSDQVVIVPLEFGIRIGATVRSVAVRAG